MKVFATAAALFASLTPYATAGYVTMSGTNFELNGKPFYVFGTNAYWASETTLVSKAAGVKLVVPFVNNWSDYGGLGVYVQQLGGKYHDDFYTDEKIKAAYKNFIKTFVQRYAGEETIMAWQLCNECRCTGSGTLKESGNCNATTLTDWMAEMSSYIKSLDSNHLVASGSEGFLNTDKSVYVYSGPSGVDFDANLSIDSIDYGAYHAYPDTWGVATSEAKSWGVKWIEDHV
ncbi:hypothetical protein JG687_00016902, partial [Phytophthora cactorum]